MFQKISSRFAVWALVLICVISFSFMLYAAHTDSAIVDELAHIPAGYGYVHDLSYNLNPEHPPLIKALAALPVLFINPTFPTTSTAWTTEVNGEWDMGYQFLYGVGNNANEIIDTARVLPILITLLVVLFIWLLARGLMGDWWALLPATLFALSPTVLAQGHYVTTDVGAAFGTIFSFYYFLKYVEKPSRKYLWFAGLSFGVAQLTKFSTPLLIPLYILLAFVLWLRNTIIDWHSARARVKTFFLRGLKWLWRLILIFAIGYVCIVYPVYFLFTVNYSPAKQLSDTQYLLGSFAGGATPAGQLCNGMRCFADADIFMAHSTLLRPYAEYLLGLLMSLQRVDGGNTIYFLGQIRESGGWIYFPVLFLIKETIPTLIIVLLALVLALWWMLRRDKREGRGRWRRIIDYIGVNFAEFSMALFIIIYWGYSMQAPLNIGFRHLLPTLPFIYILAAGVWRKWITQINLPMFGTGGAATFGTGGTGAAGGLATAQSMFMSVAATTR
ncbi:MAG TPA: glycosyltransferase family 39 protein, partial [Candidatus Paceibacterota bacterium]|nr:glycosyltransferase family 39 protein [Candidatus Paceibacterota bacterium]